MEAVGGDSARRAQLAPAPGDPSARTAALGRLSLEDRRLAWDACLNVRDLGGLRTIDGRTTKRGVLVRASMVGTLSPEGASAMRAHRVRTVIDLRWPEEISQQASIFASAVTYRSIPVDSDRQLALIDHVDDEAMAKQLAALARPESGIAAAIEAMAGAEPATLVHCSAGRDRTGIVIALVLAAVGVVDEDIVADYRASDDALADEYARFSREQPDAAPGVALAIERRRRVMDDVLRVVRSSYGDARGYLSVMGVTPQPVSALRAMLVE